MATRPFVDTLREIEFGTLLDELADVQKEVIAAVMETNKSGEIVIKLSYKPEGQGQLTIAADIKQKAPKLPRGKSLFFVTPERNLSRQNPRQQELEGLRTVSNDNEKPLREVNNG
jgi:hypothetical protein